ncbi:MAG: hypothetical protein ACP5E5_07330 [Acidobacteriaceae bacterium]
MQLVRRFPLQALFCAFAVLLCELVSQPYASSGIADDGTYALMAQHLADTGHIVYNGWATAMLGGSFTWAQPLSSFSDFR